MTALTPEVEQLAAAVAEVLNIPLPSAYTVGTMEQHRQVLQARTYSVYKALEGIADGHPTWTLEKACAFIREALTEYPLPYEFESAVESEVAS